LVRLGNMRCGVIYVHRETTTRDSSTTIKKRAKKNGIYVCMWFYTRYWRLSFHYCDDLFGTTFKYL
jgi:hypothetical protein